MVRRLDERAEVGMQHHLQPFAIRDLLDGFQSVRYLTPLSAVQPRPGLVVRLEWRDFGALRVGLVSRYDLIFF